VPIPPFLEISSGFLFQAEGVRGWRKR